MILVAIVTPLPQVYKLEPRGYDIQVGRLVQLKHFELALEIAVSHPSCMQSCDSHMIYNILGAN